MSDSRKPPREVEYDGKTRILYDNAPAASRSPANLEPKILRGVSDPRTESTDMAGSNAERRPSVALGGSRILLRKLREIMEIEEADTQMRLDRLTAMVASTMVADVCSIYIRRGPMLELCATTGLAAEAVHRAWSTAGLPSFVVETAQALNITDAPGHPRYHLDPAWGAVECKSFLGVPIARSERVFGVITVENRASRLYGEEEVEALQTIAMVLSEMVASGALGDLSGPMAQRNDAPVFERMGDGRIGIVRDAPAKETEDIRSELLEKAERFNRERLINRNRTAHLAAAVVKLVGALRGGKSAIFVWSAGNELRQHLDADVSLRAMSEVERELPPLEPGEHAALRDVVQTFNVLAGEDALLKRYDSSRPSPADIDLAKSAAPAALALAKSIRAASEVFEEDVADVLEDGVAASGRDERSLNLSERQALDKARGAGVNVVKASVDNVLETVGEVIAPEKDKFERIAIALEALATHREPVFTNAIKASLATAASTGLVAFVIAKSGEIAAFLGADAATIGLQRALELIVKVLSGLL